MYVWYVCMCLGDITAQGFEKKKAKLLAPYLSSGQFCYWYIHNIIVCDSLSICFVINWCKLVPSTHAVHVRNIAGTSEYDCILVLMKYWILKICQLLRCTCAFLLAFISVKSRASAVSVGWHHPTFQGLWPGWQPIFTSAIGFTELALTFAALQCAHSSLSLSLSLSLSRYMHICNYIISFSMHTYM